MNQPSFDLRRFEKRLRLGRAFRYSFIAATAGSLLATIWSLLDLAGISYADARAMAAWILLCALLGVIAGLFQPISSKQLAKSIDRRAGLADRLISALTVQDSAFTADLKADAAAKLSAVTAASVFPIKVGRQHAGMVFSFALPFAIFFVSYTHLLLNPAARAERLQMMAAAPAIEHVLAPLTKDPALSAKESELAKELQRYQKELERGSLDKEAAVQKAVKISQDAERLMHEQNGQTQKSLDSAESAMDQMKKDQLEQAGIQDPSLQQLSGKALEDKLEQLAAKAPTQHEMSDLQKQIDDLQKKLAQPNLSREQRESLKSQLSKLQSQMQQLKLSDAVKKMLDRIHNDPEFKELQKMMEEMRKGTQSSEQSNHPPLTKEQLDEMEHRLEELAKELKTDKDIQEYIKRLEEALKHGGKAGNCAGVCAAMSSSPMGGGAPDTTPGPPSGAPINMSDKETAGRGTTHEVAVQPDQRNSDEPTPYVEQRGLAKLTGPSSIPLLKAIPASERKAEEAIGKQKVPKEHQERVKKYFEALEGR